jgi:hypothetical protein
MLENSNLLTIFLLLILGFIVLFFSGRKYLEHFEAAYVSTEANMIY